eukprot:Phypoly_transcript_16648.p1 GENE.Phypoly_transcript_16648~~Phypoly_transcript_16648.p1  ORF type:complete len:194 (+),score=27.40 Phypoly_transcript_16648:107-688(+)
MSVYRLVLVGLGGVGKSCLTIQFISQRFIEDYDPTLEDSYRKHVTVADDECLLDIYDTAGQEDFSAVRDQYMRTGDGFLCVYSVTHAASFHEVNSLHDHILRVKDSEEVPFVLVGNKCDLESHREVPKEKGVELANKLKCKFLESSAKERINVTESFFELVQAIKAYRVVHDKTREPGSEKKEGTRKKPCIVL